MTDFQIVHGKIITPFRILEGKTIVIHGNRIDKIVDQSNQVFNMPVIDAHGNYIAPGFIDIHTHGGGGYSHMDGSAQAIVEAAAAHVKFGTTSLNPTTVACSTARLMQFIKEYEAAVTLAKGKGPNLVGIHLEGPYLSQEQKGAQDGGYITNPIAEDYEKIIEQTTAIVRWDAAPELPGGLRFGDFMRKNHIIPAIAHSNATFDETLLASEHGFTHITHLYSGTSTVKREGPYRVAGINECVYLHDHFTVEIIADGHHLPPALLKLIYKIKGPSRIILITDAMRAAAANLSRFRVGDGGNGLDVCIENGVAMMPDHRNFAGSIATMDSVVRNMIRLADVPLTEAVRMATYNPAQFLGIEDCKGSIIEGMDADLVIFDKNIGVKSTIVQGVEVYRASESKHHKVLL